MSDTTTMSAEELVAWAQTAQVGAELAPYEDWAVRLVLPILYQRGMDLEIEYDGAWARVRASFARRMADVLRRDREVTIVSAYAVRWTDGRRGETYESYDAAVDALRAELGDDAVIGHDGDLTAYGDRTLAWRGEADSEDDDGARAVASIVEVRS